jgi:parallel beta-helix repeat protein
MNKKLVLLAFLITCLVGMLVLSYHVQPVEAMYSTNNEIDINDDGSISNETAPIWTADNNTYTLTGDINFTSGSNGIVINRPNIVFEGNGHSLLGDTIYNGYGLSLTRMANVIIQNVTVKGFGININLVYSSNCTIRGSNCVDAHPYAVSLVSSTNNVVYGNSITASTGRGIYLYFSSNNNNVTRNYVAGNAGSGISIESSSGCHIFHNSFINNANQTRITGSVANAWDDGSKGNYWSDYLTRYPYATEIDKTGVGNTFYVIDANNIDYYPLMNPIAIPEFPTFLVLAMFMLATLCAGFVYRRKRT